MVFPRELSISLNQTRPPRQNHLQAAVPNLWQEHDVAVVVIEAMRIIQQQDGTRGARKLLDVVCQGLFAFGSACGDRFMLEFG